MSAAAGEGGNAEPAMRRMPALLAAGEVILLALLFFVASSAPPPDVNEAHYLAKARRFWEPEWCQGDLFLDSANPHWVFYAAFGGFAQLWGLTAAAWISRAAAWLWLAFGVQRVANACVPRVWASLWVGAALVLLTRLGHASGEWLIGGAESKCFAYGFVLLAVAGVLREKWSAAWIYLGAACAWHVLVGGWAAVALAGVAACEPRRLPIMRQTWPAAAAGAALALLGVWPALALTQAPPEIVRDANSIYVWERLPHHLVPWAFGAERWLAFGLLTASAVASLAWEAALLRSRGAGTASPGAAAATLRRRALLGLCPLALVAIGWACAALALNATDLAAALLKFYWFRLADVFVPLALALSAATHLARWHGSPQPAAQAAFALCWIGALGAAMAWSLLAAGNIPKADMQSLLHGEPRAAHAQRLHEWRAVCAWIRLRTPPGALVLTPRRQQSFKWYAHRAEAANWKDVPQDAVSLVEWRRRVQAMYDPRLSPLELADRRAWECRRLGVQFAVLETGERAPDAWRLVYRSSQDANARFRVFELPSAAGIGARDR